MYIYDWKWIRMNSLDIFKIPDNKSNFKRRKQINRF